MEGDKKPFDHIIHAFPVKESLGCNSTRGQALWRVPILSLLEKGISECSVVSGHCGSAFGLVWFGYHDIQNGCVQGGPASYVSETAD